MPSPQNELVAVFEKSGLVVYVGETPYCTVVLPGMDTKNLIHQLYTVLVYTHSILYSTRVQQYCSVLYTVVRRYAAPLYPTQPAGRDPGTVRTLHHPPPPHTHTHPRGVFGEIMFALGPGGRRGRVRSRRTIQ